MSTKKNELEHWQNLAREKGFSEEDINGATIEELIELVSARFTNKEIIKVAHLARLAIPKEHIKNYTDTINRILNLVDLMKTINTDNIEPLSNPLDATQLLRADEVTETNQRELYQSIAPRVEEGLYLVPKVIE